jgi:nucleoside-diphosphate-sugar epimerase/glycosyltransferase involved in cell wall biosynthesis
MAKQKILILGASGFLGSNLVNHAVKNNLDVYGTFRRKNFIKNKKAKYFFFDSTNFNLKEPFLKKKFDIIINASGNVDRSNSKKKIFSFFFSHTSPILYLLEKNRNAKFINIGSLLENSIKKQDISFYVFLKKITGEISHFLKKKENYQITSLRFGQVYGPGENKKRFISYLLSQNALNLKTIHNSASVRNYTYIDDALEIIFQLIYTNSRFSTLSIFSNQFMSNLDVINIIEKIKQIKIKYIFSKNIKFIASHTVPNNLTDRQIFIKDPISLNEGIVRMLLQKKSLDSRKSKISIVINSYNGAKYLNTSINSILQQTYKNWEIIFWDNCSNDLTEEIIKEYNDDRIKYFKSKKFNGLAVSRNMAIAKTTGEFVAFLDVDDSWMPNKLLHQISFMIAEKSLVSVTDYNVTLGKYGFKYYSKKNLKSGHINLNKTYSIAFSTLMLHSSILKKHKFNLNFEIIGDYDFITRISKIYYISCLDEVLSNYLLHSSSYSQKNYSKHVKELKFWSRLRKNDLNRTGNKLLLHNLNYLIYCDLILKRKFIIFFNKLKKDKIIKNKLIFVIKIFFKMYLI